MSKPILCLDFDGVLHSYTSGWQGADIIPDPPVDQMATFLAAAVGEFRVAIYSSRSHQPGGIDAMRFWLRYWLCMVMDLPDAEKLLAVIEFPNYKPSAMVTLDDRAITFTGTFPPIDKLRAFKPWNKP